ncbi:WXG100 family type VII secretion target [Streptomyces sp. WP-1]|uniref:WXG100 family type VII secretion target n=1 Tax=Streptomyces sp. WP-1 TaxID=3041497 RepID=UPI002647D144|nr:WXG100 family type VII secretion target [Streptomyces sp. WP-1]WKE73205.1 WXG100 family type VII secretion target [Streptomyces sp. WP-1]
MGSPDYNTGGFSDSGDGIFADPGNDPGSIDDYNSWDWKQIMAAINGMSAGTGSDANQERAKGISDPQSLMDAAGHFLDAQVVLAGIAKSLADQANALAGENGPWKGAAADAFCDMINTFSRQVKATADVLSGGEAGNSVPQQLANNSVNLHNAQVKIADIDAWYADQAVKMGVKPMSNGLIPIHEKPQLVEMMTSDMRAVLKSLAGEYQVTIDSVHTPPPVTSPTDSPDVTDDVPDVSDPDLTDPNLPDVNAPDPQAFSAPDTSGLPNPDMPGVNPISALATPSPFSGGTDVGGDAPGLDGLPNDAFGNDTLDPNALDKALNPAAFPGGSGVGDDLPTLTPTAFPGGSGVGDDLPTLTPTAFPGGLNTGGGVGKFPTLADNLAEDPASWSGTDGLPEDFPGDTGVGGTGGLNTGEGLGDVAPEQFPGGLGTESELPDGLQSPAGLNDALESPSLDGLPAGEKALGTGGMPMMPGMGAGGMPQSGAPDPSDASGLIDSEAEPWLGDPSVADEIGGKGAEAGGDGLGLPVDEAEAAHYPGGLSTDEGLTGTGAGGMPMMPGMGGGGMPQSGALDPSDASGLIDSEAEPWLGDPEVGEEIGGAGALPGGEGLGLPLDEEAEALPGALATEEGLTGAGAGGMPMMPGMGAGGPAAQGTTDPSDASGLLEPEGEPWTGEPGVPDEIVGGAGAGGEGLALPDPTEGMMIGSDGLPIAPQPTAAPVEPLAETGDADAAWADEAGAGETGAVAAGEAAPAMPGMLPGAGAPSNGARDERSDASGLLTPDADAWTPEAEADGERPVVSAQEGVGEGALPATLLGAAAGATAAAVAATALGAAAAGAAEESAERRHRRRDEDDAAALVVLPVGGEGTARPLDAGDPDVPDVPDDPELLDDHVALTPATGAEAEAEDTAAWDSAGAAFVPLLWSVPTEDEEEVLAPGYATEDAGTWTGEAGATAEEADGPRLSTWRPNRSGAAGPGEMVIPAVPLRSFAGDPSELTAELPPQEAALEEAEAEEELAQPSRGIADLLVQEGDTWGTAASDGSGAVL